MRIFCFCFYCSYFPTTLQLVPVHNASEAFKAMANIAKVLIFDIMCMWFLADKNILNVFLFFL